MKKEKIQKWLSENSEKINSMLKIMCSINIKDASWKFSVENTIGGGSWCSVDTSTHKILIHIGVPEWLDDEDDNHDRYVKVLGYEPGDKDLFALYMDLGMHEFMHACITRTGNTLIQIAAKFPMRNSTASRYQKEFYRQNVEKLVHFWHNAVCDARIENIGKNCYNVAQYFDFGRIIDYMVADTPAPSKSWNFGYAMLQLGVIGKYPKFPIDPEAITAIESVTKHPVPGSSKTKDLYEEFLCEPHPVISVRKFASWFDIPEFHDYVAKIIYEEVETQSKTAEDLAKMLANMPKEVRISGGGGGSGIQIQMPSTIQVKKPSPGNGKDPNEQKKSSNSKSDNGSGSEDKKDSKSEKDKEGSKSGNGNGQNKNKKSEEKSGGKDASGKQAEDKEANNGSRSQGGSDSGNTGDNNSESSDKDGKVLISNSPCPKSKNTDDYDTFDENGEWSLSKSGTDGGESEELAENEELRTALDVAIKEIGKAAKTVAIKRDSQKQKNASKSNNAKTENDVTIDTSFVPTKFAPASVVAAAKPLRAVIKRLQSENQEDEITGLKAGSLNTRALYRLKNQDLSIFKERKLPTIVDAVYYICWDGSGSMCGTKQMESAYACAVIEEAVRGLYPMKIINFSTCRGVVHYVVKDFDNRSKKNAAYSFGAQRSFSGGNKDGYSIRQCTDELIKRKETNKFLIILSDGAPSDYDSYQDAVDDVKNAVAFARAHKIDVTSIFFGPSYERNSQIEMYKEMYGASHIISCEPNEIVAHMVNIVKKNILKR